MKSRTFIFAVLLLLALTYSKQSQAQNPIQSDAQNGYVQVNNYAGVINPNTFGYRIHLYGYNIHVPNWSLSVKVEGQIRNSEGKILDPSKLKMKFNYISPEPSFEQIGTTNAPVPLSQSVNYLFTNSKYPLFTTSAYNYKQIFFSLDLHVEGGAYLEALKSWQEYFMNVIFQVRNQSGQIITEAPHFVRLQIQPSGTPPSGPTYSIQLIGGAASGILEFAKPQDFLSGIQQIYPSGLSVISSTPYQLQVRTLTSDFIANSLTVPVSTVGL